MRPSPEARYFYLRLYSFQVVALSGFGTKEAPSIPLRMLNAGSTPSRQEYQTALALLESVEALHWNEPYYRPAGVDRLFNQLSTALDQINGVEITDNFSTDSSAQYGYVTNRLLIRPAAVGLDVVHELVHAWDDLNNWYIRPSGTDYEHAEALAYATENMLKLLSDKLFPLQTMADAAPPTQAAAQLHWSQAWFQLNQIQYADVKYFSWTDLSDVMRKLTAADVNDVGSKLGFKLSESQLEPIYSTVLSDYGLPPGTISGSISFTLMACFR